MLERSFAHEELRALKWRLPLNDDFENYLSRLERGFHGENEFSKKLAAYNEYAHVYDFTFEIDGSMRQIDALLLFNNECVLFEVKNYIGDFIYKNDEFYTYYTMQKISSPIRQLDDAAEKFSELLYRLGIRRSVRKFVVFINEEFHLYQAPDHQSIITRPQLRRSLNQLTRHQRPANSATLELKDTLLKLNIKDTRPAKVLYQYEDLKKGLFCYKDGAVLKNYNRVTLICPTCGNKTSIKDAVLQSAQDFNTLFPREKLTIPALYDFSGGLLSKYNLRKALFEACERHSQARGTYYTFPK